MWNKIARFILRNRIVLLITVISITAFMGYELSNINMDYTYASMLSKSDPVAIDNEHFKQIFGSGDGGIVIGFADSSFFELKKFRNFQRLCSELKDIDYVSNVLTVSNAIALQQVTIESDDGSKKRQFEIQNIFPKKIKSQTELDSLKNVFLSIPFYKGLLYNDTSNVFLMNVSLDKKIVDSKLRIPVVNKIAATIKQFCDNNNVEYHISGHPYIRTKLMDLIKTEIILFIILAAIVCIAILYLFFRTIKVVGVALLVVGVAVVWIMGLMGLCGYKITILTGMIPPLIIIIGIPNTIFLLNKYHSETQRHGNKILGLYRVITKIGNAVFLSNLTTALGFSTFIFTSSSILVDFGVLASCGIMFVFLIALILIPSIFSFSRPPSDRYTKHLHSKVIGKLTNVLTTLVTRHRVKIYIAVGVIIVTAIIGTTQIKRSGYILDDIPTDSEVYQDLKFLERHFVGVSPLEIAINAKDSLSGLELVDQIRKIDTLQMALATYPELSRSMSVADAMKFLYFAYCKNKPDKYCLPPDPKTFETIAKRLPFDTDQPLAKSFIDSSKHTTRVSVNIADVGIIKMEKLVPKIRNDIKHVFPDSSYNTMLIGSTIMNYTGMTYLIKNLFTSLCIAIVVIALLMFLLQRSCKIVIMLLIPNIIPMLVTAGLMGYLGVPLKMSTILVFGIALGISVDGAIHYITKYRQELESNNKNIGMAVRAALRETGISMMYSSAILFFGFLVFTFSGYGGTVALGLLTSITLLTAMFCNLILLPTMLLTRERFINKKLTEEAATSTDLQTDDDTDDSLQNEIKTYNDTEFVDEILNTENEKHQNK